MTWAQKQRLSFITFTLSTAGRINASDLEREFEIGHSTAVRDFRRFKTAYPGLMRYEPVVGAYVMGKP